MKTPYTIRVAISGTASGGTGVNSSGGTAPPAAPPTESGHPVVTYASLVWVSSQSLSEGYYDQMTEVTGTSETNFAGGATEETFSHSLEYERGGNNPLWVNPNAPEPNTPFGELSDSQFAYSSSQILANGTVIAIDRHNIESRQIGQFTSLQESTIEQQAPTPQAPVSGSPSPATTNIVPLIAVHDPAGWPWLIRFGIYRGGDSQRRFLCRVFTLE